uniref:PIN-like domain-containing protein n=1 Tax=Acinetobacter baumannii TaxID=470 RepID=UPI001362D5D8
ILKFLNSRLWIPHHVALEFQRNRLKVIKNHRIYIQDMQKETDDFLDSISFDDKIFHTFKNKFTSKTKHLNIYTKIEDIINNISSEIEDVKDLLKEEVGKIRELITDIDQDKIYLTSKDYIREEFDYIFSGNSLGNNIFDTQAKLDDIFKNGENRYKNMTPPGYKDEKVKENEVFTFNGLTYKSKFGDLLIFKQIIEYSKDPNIKNIIFISEDVKEDWRIVENLNGKKILGARPELKQEIFLESSVDDFYIFDINNFLKYTTSFLNIGLNPSSVDDIKNSLLFIMPDIPNEHINDFMEGFNLGLNLKDNKVNTQKDTLEKDIKIIPDLKLYTRIFDLNQKLEILNNGGFKFEFINLPHSVHFFTNYNEILGAIISLELKIAALENDYPPSELTSIVNSISQDITALNQYIKINSLPPK